MHKVRLYVSQEKKIFFSNSIFRNLLQLSLLASECSHCTTDVLIYPAQQEGHSDPDCALVPNILTLVTM